MLSERLVEQPRAAAASAPAANSTSTPPSRSIPGPRPDAFSLGSSEAIDHAGDAAPRGSPRRRAAGGRCGRRAPASRRSSPPPGPRRAARQSSSAARSACRSPSSAWKPSPIDLAVADDHRPDQRVRAHPAPAALRELQGAPELAVRWLSLSVRYAISRLIDWSVNQDSTRPGAAAYATRDPCPGTPGHEADHPDPLPQRGGDAAAPRSPSCRARSTGFDEVEWLVIDDGSTDRTVEVAREHGVEHLVRLHQQQGARDRVPGRDRRRAEARRRRDRQHRRRQPVPRRRHPEARRADPRRRGRPGRRRPRGRRDRALLRRQEAAAAARQLGRAPRSPAPGSPTRPPAFAPTTARRRCSCSVVSNFTYTLESLIQAGKMLVAVDDVAGRHQRADARVAPLPLDRRLRAPQRARDPPHLRALRAAARLHHRGARRRCCWRSPPGCRSSSTGSSTATPPATSSR